MLHLNPTPATYIPKLERNLGRHFKRSSLTARTDDEHALFIDITQKGDLNSYFLKIGIDTEGFAAVMKKEALWLILMFCIAMILSRFLGYYFARKIARPIENLSQLSADVAKGDLTNLAPFTSEDEFGELSTNFNKMVVKFRNYPTGISQPVFIRRIRFPVISTMFLCYPADAWDWLSLMSATKALDQPCIWRCFAV